MKYTPASCGSRAAPAVATDLLRRQALELEEGRELLVEALHLVRVPPRSVPKVLETSPQGWGISTAMKRCMKRCPDFPRVLAKTRKSMLFY